MANSKIAAVTKTANTWQSQSGSTMYEYSVTMEDGTNGIASSTNPDNTPYGVGDEVEYTKTENKYGIKLKVKKANTGYSGGGGFDSSKDKVVGDSWAIKSAIHVLSYKGEGDIDTFMDSVERVAKRLLILRDKL